MKSHCNFQAFRAISGILSRTKSDPAELLTLLYSRGRFLGYLREGNPGSARHDWCLWAHFLGSADILVS